MVFNKKINLTISIVILFTMFVSLSAPIFATESNNITTRNLAMFATIAYADLENITNYIPSPDTNINNLTFNNYNMVTDSQLSSITSSTELLGLNLSGQTEDTYTYLFYNLASTNEVSDWKIVNYSKIQSLCFTNKIALFSAMTFKRGNDIVIAYRGTDFNDIGDWLQDLSYGLNGIAGQEVLTQAYALKVAEAYPNCNIYVTGHSLGGYLAQIGGAKLLSSKYRNNVKEIGYFNGMGLFFASNIKSTLLDIKIINQEAYNKLTDMSSEFNKIQTASKNTLDAWYKQGGKLVSYHINGDPISSLGTHCGKSVGFNAAKECIDHHRYTNITSNNKIINNLIKFITDIDDFLEDNGIARDVRNFLDKISTDKLDLRIYELNSVNAAGKLVSSLSTFAFNTNIGTYAEMYGSETLMGYIWTTHETDSFFGVPAGKLEIHMNTPPTIKYKKQATMTVIVNTGGEELKDTNLNTSDFTLSNGRRLKIVKVYLDSVSKDSENNNIYTYKVVLQGGIIIGNSRVTLKAGSLSTDSNSNNSIPSNYIRTKLR